MCMLGCTCTYLHKTVQCTHIWRETKRKCEYMDSLQRVKSNISVGRGEKGEMNSQAQEQFQNPLKLRATL